MIRGSVLPVRVKHSCGRCGVGVRPGVAWCRDCHTVESPAVSGWKARARARAEGWDFDNPHLGDWGTTA